MKKMVISMLVAAVAAISQAASWNWNWGTATDEDYTGITSGTLTLYLNGVEISSSAVTDGAAGGNVDYTTAWNGQTISATWTATHPTAGAVTLSATAASAFSGLLADGSPADMAALNQTMTDIFSSMVASAGDSAVFNWNNGSTGWTPVPEPCSVALLLLGVAAIGLKRKIQ